MAKLSGWPQGLNNGINNTLVVSDGKG